MQNEQEKNLYDRLSLIARRIQEIAEIEARAAPIGGYGARGEMMPKKLSLIEKTDNILAELEELYRQQAPSGTQK